MIRNAFLLCASILLAAICAGCSQYVLPPARPLTGIYPIPILQNPTVDCTSADTFAASALLIDPNFSPETKGSNYQPPTGSSFSSDFVRADLKNAYTSAPPFLKAELCKLKGIFITQAPRSWGFRENTGNQNPGCAVPTDTCGTYIALAYTLWNNGTTPAPTFHDYENSIAFDLLGAAGPQYGFANPDTSATTVLAVLAHEMGHILWWKRDVAHFACQTPPPGSKRIFRMISWQSVADTPQFHQFGAQQHPGLGVPGNVPSNASPDKDKVLGDIQALDYDSATDDLEYIYGGDWASLFATVSPDEDFVETFVLRSLTSAVPSPLQNLQVLIPYNPSVDVVIKLYNNSITNLYKKASWIQTCLGY